jgi:hypothetical protein
MEKKYVIWHVQGGLGKNIAASSLTKDIKEKYKDRELILVCILIKQRLYDPNIDKVYQIGTHPYFYENYTQILLEMYLSKIQLMVILKPKQHVEGKNQ